jgi:hypothetical protein
MPDFRVYFIGEDGHFVGVEQLLNVAEAEALEKARQLLDGHDVEVWQGERQVAVLSKKDGPALVRVKR